MSGSPQLYPEDQHEIFVAIPPPLVPPLARQLSSSHHGIVNPQQLATPTTSTDNSFEHWTSFETLLLQQQHLQQQQQRAMAVLGGDRGSPGTSSAGIAGSSGTGGQNRGLPPVSVRSGSRTTLDSNTSNASNTNTNTTTTNRASARIGGGGGVVPLSTPVSSPQQPPLPISLPVQLLNRLYPFSAMSTSVGSGSGVHPSVTESSSCASSSSAGSYLSRNFMSGFGCGSGVNISGGFGSRSATSVMQQHQPDMMARRNSTELARTAAATAIVNTLVSRGNSAGGGGGGASGSGSSEAVGLSIPRGDSPYIPSSLSMLFSDPEIMQVQTEVDRHRQQQQQQRQRRTSSSQLTLSHSGSGVGSGIFAHSEGDDQEGAAEEHGLFGEETRLLQDSPSGNEGSHTITTGAATGREGDDGGYGYEVVQEDQQEDVFRPYVAMMARDDYLAPHEPSSSSPLFPSPLTTLGGFASGTSMLDVAEDQQAQAAGRIWRDYGTMMENGGGGGGVQFQRQQQLQNPTAAQSHAAYYHAVSNYHYSYNSNPHDDARGGSSSSTSQVNPCVPTGHYAVPEDWQWRRQRGRGASHQSYGSVGGNGGSGTQRNNGDGPEDNWLWGM
ncbi:hypothetical protein BGZ88_009548 [Linnemannia elongata]|nr:hypothetical protein BGZ88_009548 [Linnemannia elongata]